MKALKRIWDRIAPVIEDDGEHPYVTRRPMVRSLMADDECRCCFHGPHPEGVCVEDCFMGTLDGVEVFTQCGCDEYVDLEAESRIVVTVGDPMADAEWADYLWSVRSEGAK